MRNKILPYINIIIFVTEQKLLNTAFKSLCPGPIQKDTIKKLIKLYIHTINTTHFKCH